MFTGSTKTTQSTGAQLVNLGLAQELLAAVLNETVVKVLTTEMSVTTGGEHLVDALLDLEQRHIERTSAQIEDEHMTVRLGVQTVGQSGRSGLVDDAQHLQTGQTTGVLGGLTLRVVKVGRDSHHSLGHTLAQVLLGNTLHVSQHHATDLLREEGASLALVLTLNGGLVILIDDFEGPVLDVLLDAGLGETATNQTFGTKDGVLRIARCLVQSSITD
mmetsp:Transcript_3931/g.9611  ORF Transcript_3931/g.9611 Transcript_3931/m.9611 type:complete len:217 (+) Transcript_3931:1165-1815(+)